MIVAGGEAQQGAAKKLADGLAARGVKAEVKTGPVLTKALYPRIWNPYANYYSAVGEVKMAEGAEVKTRIAIVAKADGSFSAKDEAGKEWGNDWRQPNSLVTVGGDGFAEYMNQDSESVFEPGKETLWLPWTPMERRKAGQAIPVGRAACQVQVRNGGDEEALFCSNR